MSDADQRAVLAALADVLNDDRLAPGTSAN